MIIIVRKRPRTHAFADPIFEDMDFPDLSDAIKWMEEENERKDREFDIASVRPKSS